MVTKIVRMRFGTATLKLSIWDDEYATLSDLISNDRGQGHATTLMQKACKYADDNQLTLFLEAKRFGHPIGPDNKVLQSFYERFGFVREDRRDPIIWMHRDPSQNLHGM